jgi:uncharacterized LabA/DUF88 family protein
VAEKVCVFIDGSNFFHACRENLGRTDVNIGAFAQWLVTPARTLVRTYYYNCRLSPEHDEAARLAQQGFFGALDRTPYLEVRLGKLVKRDTTCRACGDRYERWTEKGVDMRIGVDMLSAAAKSLYETAILVTGDGDLAEAVRAVKELGQHVEVAAFQRGRAYELVQVADVNRELTAADMAQFYLRL